MPKRSKPAVRHHGGHRHQPKKGRKETRKRKNKAKGCDSTSFDSDHETTEKRRRQQSHQHSQHHGNAHQISTPQLTMTNYREVTKFLRDLNNDELLGVGVALGLHRPTLQRMKDLLGDMVAAWLRENDNVTVASGRPSWASLATALEDIGHKGIANKIRQGTMQVTQTATPLSPEMSDAFSRYRNFLESYYDTNLIARDDKLSIAPCSEFISLVLVKNKLIKTNDCFSQSTLYGGRDEISAHKVPLELDTILTAEDKFVLVEGAPGIGKSTLSWELCRKWDTLKFLQRYSIVLLLKLREGRVQNASSLNELFYHEDKALCESVVSEVLRCEGEGVLLILDGFDEMPASVVRNKEILIMRIIRNKCIPKATRIVTSRPSALHETKKCFPQKFRHVEIVGFTEENIERYAKKAFESEPSVLLEFEKFIFSNPIIKSLMCIPVNCAILAQSYKDIMRSSKQVPKTTTQLYTMLTRVLIRRHLIAIGRWDEDSEVPSDLKDLPEDVKGDLERVSKLAYTGLFKEDIQLVFTNNDVGKGFHGLGLLSEVKEMYVCEGARTSYSFLHLSIQEFLAAWHVSCHHELAEEALAKTLCSDSAHLHVFGRILAGLIGITDLYVQYLMKWYGKSDQRELIMLYACHCFYEAQDTKFNSVFTILLSEDKDALRIGMPLDMYVFGYCLANVPYQWPRLIVHSSFDMLVSSLSDHAGDSDVLGSIRTLDLFLVDSSPKLKVNDLPYSLLDNVQKLELSDHISPPLLDDMPVLPHLRAMTIEEPGFEPIPFRNEYVLNFVSSQFSSLKVLEVRAILTERCVQILTKAIANSSTIEEVVLHTRHYHDNDYEYRMNTLAQVVLACPSLKHLSIDFPFVLSNCKQSHRNLQGIDCFFYNLRVHKLPKLLDWLYNFANACKEISLTCLFVHFEYMDVLLDHCEYHNAVPPLSSLPYACVIGYYDCISLINVCLHLHWTSIEEYQVSYFGDWYQDKKFNLPFSIPYTQFHLSSLSRALRRDPDTSQLKLRRSKSLSDLVCLKTLEEHTRKYSLTFRDIHFTPVKKSESCPDLVGIKSLHPLMAENILKENYDERRIEGFPIPDPLLPHSFST